MNLTGKLVNMKKRGHRNPHAHHQNARIMLDKAAQNFLDGKDEEGMGWLIGAVGDSINAIDCIKKNKRHGKYTY